MQEDLYTQWKDDHQVRNTFRELKKEKKSSERARLLYGLESQSDGRGRRRDPLGVPGGKGADSLSPRRQKQVGRHVMIRRLP